MKQINIFCKTCSKVLQHSNGRGRKKQFCDNICRQKFYRKIKSANWSFQFETHSGYTPEDLIADLTQLKASTENICQVLGIPEELMNQYLNGTSPVPLVVVFALRGLNDATRFSRPRADTGRGSPD